MHRNMCSRPHGLRSHGNLGTCVVTFGTLWLKSAVTNLIVRTSVLSLSMYRHILPSVFMASPDVRHSESSSVKGARSLLSPYNHCLHVSRFPRPWSTSDPGIGEAGITVFPR